MERMAIGELGKILVLLSMGMAGLAALFINMVVKVRGTFKPYQKATLCYVLVSLLAFAALAGTAYWHGITGSLAFYLFYQFCFLLYGMLHVRWMPKYLKWSGYADSLWTELFFTLFAGLAGSMVFLIVYRFFYPQGMEYAMTTSIIFFIVPWFVYQTFQSVVVIPPKMLKLWFYPLRHEADEPDVKKFKHLLVISFEFHKQVRDAHFTNFRAKAPQNMELGELFYYFINDYNDRHQQNRIEFINGTGQPHGWIFYKKPMWYEMTHRHMDAGKTIAGNNIKENDIIICKRSYHQIN